MQVSDVLKDVTLTIPFPSHFPRGRGRNAVGKFDTTLKARCNIEEYQAVDEAAEAVGLTRSEFVRWVAFHAAKCVLGDRYGKQDDPDVATSTT